MAALKEIFFTRKVTWYFRCADRLVIMPDRTDWSDPIDLMNVDFV